MRSFIVSAMIKDDELYRSMMRYYDGMADRLEEHWNRESYTDARQLDTLFQERQDLDRLVATFGGRRLLDIGCGSGHWVRLYSGNCQHVVLLDQSARMLARALAACHSRPRKSTVLVDALDVSFRPDAFDAIFVANVLSHLTPSMCNCLLDRIRTWVCNGGKVLIVDSLRHDGLSAADRRTRHTRVNGDVGYAVYKRYFKTAEVDQLRRRLEGSAETVRILGRYFFAIEVEVAR